jgi:hypothetical protein
MRKWSKFVLVSLFYLFSFFFFSFFPLHMLILPLLFSPLLHLRLFLSFLALLPTFIIFPPFFFFFSFSSSLDLSSISSSIPSSQLPPSLYALLVHIVVPLRTFRRNCCLCLQDKIQLWHRVVWKVVTNVLEEHLRSRQKCSYCKGDERMYFRTSLTTYQTSRCHNPEDHNLQHCLVTTR